MRINQVESIQFSLTESAVLLLTDSLMFLAALGVIFFYDPWPPSSPVAQCHWHCSSRCC